MSIEFSNLSRKLFRFNFEAIVGSARDGAWGLASSAVWIVSFVSLAGLTEQQDTVVPIVAVCFFAALLPRRISMFRAFLGVTFGCLRANARTQAHLPLAPGLPPIPDSPQSALFKGDAPIAYAFPVELGGSRADVIMAATHHSDAIPQPFREWDVNHIQGPSVLDCPDGFVLTEDHTCVFAEFRKPEESCPYGSFREKGGIACVQVDSVPPDRTCPAGFEYFMRGCIRRTQVQPLLTCPPGYQQLDNMCYSVSSVPPQRRCPGTSMLVEDGPIAVCRKETLFPVSYRCPPETLLEINPLAPATTTYVTQLDTVTLSDGKPKCVADAELELERICATGFSLMAAEDYLGIQGTDTMELNRVGSRGLFCAKAAEYEGTLTCPPGFELIWTASDDEAAALDLYRGARCRPTLAFKNMKLPPLNLEAPLHRESEQAPLQIELRALHSGDVWTVFSEAHSGGPESHANFTAEPMPLSLSIRSAPASVRKTRKSVRTAPTRLLSARKLTDGFAPTITFARQSCRTADVQTLQWKEVSPLVQFPLQPDSPFNDVVGELQRATGQLVNTIQGFKQYRPVCREVQDMNPDYVCPVGSHFACVRTTHPEVEGAEPETVNPEESENIRDEGELEVMEPKAVSSTKAPKTSGTKKKTSKAPKRMLSRAAKLVSKGQVLTFPAPDLTPFMPTATVFAPPTLQFPNELRGLTVPQSGSATVQACLAKSDSRPICQRSQRIIEAEPKCDSPEQQLTVHLMQQGDKVTKVAACKEVLDEEPYLECPFGVGNVANHNGRCDVLLAAPLSATCPEGFTKGSHEKSAVSTLLGDPKKLFTKKLPMPPVMEVDSGGVCELVEYADYQITCPHGYRRERAKNTAMACLAEKYIPPSILCPPGYLPVEGLGPDEMRLDNNKACMKQVVVAPTVISYPDETNPPTLGVTGGATATACVLTKDKRLSCGVERKYHGMIDYDKQRAFGDAFKAKQDKKNRAHLEKHSS